VRCSFVLVGPADYQLAIGLQRDTGRSRAGIKDSGEMSDNLTTSTETLVKAAISVTTGQRKVIEFAVGPRAAPAICLARRATRVDPVRSVRYE
jgi:hypothetical protein